MDCISSRIYSGFIREYLLGKLNFKIKKVTSSARDGETVIISEEPIDIPWAKKVIHEIGYEMTGSSNEPYEKKGLFRFGKK